VALRRRFVHLLLQLRPRACIEPAGLDARIARQIWHHVLRYTWLHRPIGALSTLARAVL